MVFRGPEVDRGCVAACEVAAFCPVLVFGSNQGDTEGGCPGSVPAATSCTPMQWQGEGGGA